MRGLMSFLVGAMLGGLVGATIALLLAPASGDELRQQMRQQAEHIQLEVKHAAEERRRELEEQLAALRTPAKPAVN